MILSVCIITKGDEELEKLKKAVGSITESVDEIVITANGANTSETKKWCLKNPKIKYTYLKWNDNFSEQRNFCASQIRSDTDYYLWMDTDDVVVNASYLREIARISKKQEYDSVFFTYWYGCKFKGEPSIDTLEEVELEQMRERLIKPGSVYWKKRIHETPVPIDGEHYKYSQIKYSKDYPIAWLHLGADRQISQEVQSERMKRNKRLLELELEDERAKGEADPRTLLYLMKVYAEDTSEQTLKKCIELGKEYLQKSGWDQERAVCCQIMSKCLGELGFHREAEKLLLNALKEYPYYPLLYFYLARVYFNLRDYRAMKHWIDVGLSIKTDDSNTSMQNILELKALSTELLLQYHYWGERNVRKAYEAAKMLNKVNPRREHEETVQTLYDLKELDIASENTHKLMEYYRDIGREYEIPKLYESLPLEIKNLPFAIKYYNRFKEPYVWGDNEICYFANFGGESFEKWDGNSINKGIGGSEAAVIRLSEEWVKLGYSVTVYGDPKEETVVNGVKYLPYFKFNRRDKFNIFIQWRHNNLAGKINCKKFLVDLHDIFFQENYLTKTDSIDKLMVKSNYHRRLADLVPDSKFEIIGNGIN